MKQWSMGILAKLELKEAEKNPHGRICMLDYIDKLNELDTSKCRADDPYFPGVQCIS